MNTLLLEHLAAVSKIAAYRQAREHQEGVDASQGYLTTNAAGVLFEWPRTFVCHFKYDAGSRLQGIAGFTIPMMVLEIAPSTNLLRFYCGTTSATAPIVPGNNYQAVISYDGTTAVCYLNGSEAARFTVAGYAVTNVFRIGNPSYPPVGPVYSSSHFNYVLSAGEVSALWNNGDPAGYVLPAIKKYAAPFNISGITSYTWTGEIDTNYYQEVLLGRTIQSGAVVMIKGSVSDYQSGEPFVYVGNKQAMIPAQNGSFTLKVINNRDNINRIYYYGGTVGSDRRLTITINSVELIPDVALSWLDSAKQLPLNDEYLPPLFESIVIGDATPIHIMGENSYTWTGVDDPVYSYTVRCSRYFKIGEIYKVRVTISNWEAGGPPYFKIATDNTIIMSGFTGNGTYAFYITAEGIPYDYMFVYAGHGDTDRRMTITVDSIEPIAEHGYDLTANGTPQIIIK